MRAVQVSASSYAALRPWRVAGAQPSLYNIRQPRRYLMEARDKLIAYIAAAAVAVAALAAVLAGA